jgi:hypothetical protein
MTIMLWEEMLEKHEKEFAEFDKVKKAEWDKLHKSGQPTTEQYKAYEESYAKDYATFVRSTFTEAVFKYGKEQSDMARLQYLKNESKKHPDVDYFHEQLQKEIERLDGPKKERDKQLGKDNP